MGRQQSCDDQTAVIHSSIALLQERFRQLQRVKEMREERELLRFFPESGRVRSPTTAPRCYENPSKKLFFHPELIIPPVSPPLLQSSISTRPEVPQNKHDEYLAVDTPLLMSLWPTDRGILRTPKTFPKSFDDADVDTSLHL